MREFPTTYVEFEGRKEVNGKRRQFWIQDATEEWFRQMEEHLASDFLDDEPISKHLNCVADEKSVAEFRQMWRNVFQENVSLICLTIDEDGTTKLAACNALTLANKSSFKLTGKCSKTIFDIFGYGDKECDIQKKFNLEVCLRAMGLYVATSYRGEGLGQKLLETRELLCHNIGVKGTLTAFTSIISQKLAYRIGFKELVALEYAKLPEINPLWVIPGITNHTSHLKFMYKLYQ